MKRSRGRRPAAAPRLPEAPATARELALVVLDEQRRTGRFASALLDERLRSRTLAPEERRLATELVLGVIRRQGTLDALLRPHVARPPERVEPLLWTLLRLGAYQLVLLEGIPPHAAVHETVDLARRIGAPQWTGFANGVLRALERNVGTETTGTPSARAVPLSEGRFRLLREDVFADPAEDPREWLAESFSLPAWLVERWRGRLAFDQLVALGFHLNEVPTPSLRVNEMRATRDEVFRSLADAGIDAVPGDLPVEIRLGSTRRIDDLPGFEEGLFTVQDGAAMRAALLLAPKPGERVLDACAAPGTKTTHLAELMRDEGQIVATDSNPKRLKTIESALGRLGLSSVELRPVASDGSDLPEGPFDAALVDVPCSNTGVLGKRPEARWRISPGGIDELTVVQERLLRQVVARVRPGGRIVYSTCSIEPEENGGVVQRVLESTAGLRLVSVQEFLPGRPADGAYQALLERGAG